ncbi:putative ubiquitin C-terminal hydrolase [Rosellinia necatrix]|uniref:Ubiquitin carboxyl-terminal hydrolase n=1 Tax=Rosellinia necatrix TaxID=77044 RepID=A0A1S7UJF1_ROSNE|nr:putative ubiquitin C-terminal hydrolase [Rosellinia necatrix]
MSGSHLPAGQPMPGSVGGVASGPGLHGGRRRAIPAYSPHPAYHHTQHQQQANLLYPNSYMNPYSTGYYTPQQLAPHYQTGHVASPYSMPSYTTYSQRSPPPVHQTYPPIVSSSMQSHHQTYARPPPQPQQASPALPTSLSFPTTAPPPLVPAPVPQTPISTLPAQAAVTSLSPTTSQSQATATPSVPEVELVTEVERIQRYPVPWLSVPDEPFPPRSSKSKRRRRRIDVTESVELPMSIKPNTEPGETKTPSSDGSVVPDAHQGETASVVTPVTGSSSGKSIDIPSEEVHGQPAAAAQVSPKDAPSTSAPTQANKSAARTTTPAVPVIPAMPKTTHTEPKSPPSPGATLAATSSGPGPSTETVQAGSGTGHNTLQPTKAPPKLWSNLFQNQAPATTPSDPNNPGSTALGPGAPSNDAANTGIGAPGPGTFVKSNVNSLAEALRDYKVSNGHNIIFLEPRGLVNTGNMCYMNSVLQALVFCTPFYNFIDQAGQAAAYNFNSETPLIDAMVMFLREYPVIDTATSVDQLQKRLKRDELDRYGEPFTPKFVYEAIKRLPRFASMQRGHQQDAEEFLGFLLQALGDECAHIMRRLDEVPATASSPISASPGAPSPTSATNESEWLEVGKKQRAAITRSSGHATSSPISKIFSGQIRSVLRVTGQKESVTFETYQPMQLDIGDTHVNNIVDALKYYTRVERIQGDFGSTRPDTKTTKQVLIESIPPVLILHLKRFKYDAVDNSTSKLWTKIDYPLELELPKEIFSPLKRTALQTEGLGFPKYRLTAVIYHHGKSASGGHYTADILRQDNQEWIRVDDTIIRPIKVEEVAGSSTDRNPATPAVRVDQKHVTTGPTTGNRFEGIGGEDGADDEGWNRVSSAGTGTKKYSSVVNTDSPSNIASAKAKPAKDNIKDNKVAYLLFYQKI